MLEVRLVAFLKSRIFSPAMAATLAMHAAFSAALLELDVAPSSVASVPVMVSLIDSAGEEPSVAPPKPTKATVRARPVRKSPSPASTLKASERAPTDVPPDADASAPEAPITTDVATASEPAPTETVAADDAPAPASSVTLPRFNADYLNNPPPVYPSLARRLGEEGRVLLRVRVRPDGTSADIAISRSSGFARLDRAALEAVRKWRFVPARQGDVPVTASVLVPISFTLES
ncbi:energy transducer TonB [Sulfurifustis variabilis]|nr:energy transducer TonB [Sulfurifustis variabilis]